MIKKSSFVFVCDQNALFRFVALDKKISNAVFCRFLFFFLVCGQEPVCQLRPENPLSVVCVVAKKQTNSSEDSSLLSPAPPPGYFVIHLDPAPRVSSPSLKTLIKR